MREIVNRLHENRQIELAKSILENAGYTVEKIDEVSSSLEKEAEEMFKEEHPDVKKSDYKVISPESMRESESDTPSKFKVGDVLEYSGLYGGQYKSKITKIQGDKMWVTTSWIAEDTGELVYDDDTFFIEKDEDGNEYIEVWHYRGETGKVYSPSYSYNESARESSDQSYDESCQMNEAVRFDDDSDAVANYSRKMANAKEEIDKLQSAIDKYQKEYDGYKQEVDRLEIIRNKIKSLFGSLNLTITYMSYNSHRDTLQLLTSDQTDLDKLIKLAKAVEKPSNNYKTFSGSIEGINIDIRIIDDDNMLEIRILDYKKFIESSSNYEI